MSTEEQVDVYVRLRGASGFIAETRKMASSFATVESSARRMSRRTQGSFVRLLKSTIFVRRALFLMETGASIAVIGLAHAAIQFDQVIQQIAAVSSRTGKVTQSELKELTRVAIREGIRTKFSNVEAAQGLLELAKAGFTAQAATKALRGTLNLAAATNYGVADSAEVVVNVLTSFNMKAAEAGHVGDLLTRAANASVASMSDLGVAMRYASGAMNALGQTLPDTVTALALLSNYGQKGSRAGRLLGTGMQRLVDPTKKVNNGLKMLGLTVKDIQGPNGLLPLPQLLKKLHAGLRGLTKAEQGKALSQIFGKDPFRVWSPLVRRGALQWAMMAKQINNTKVTAANTAKTMNYSVSFALDQLVGSIQGVASTLLERYKPQIIAFITSITDAFQHLLEDPSAVLNFFRPFGRAIQLAFRLAIKLGRVGLPLVAVGALAVRAAFIVLDHVLEFVVNHFDTLLPLLVGAGSVYAAFKLIMVAKWIIWWVRFGLAIISVTRAILAARGAMAALSFLFMTNPLGIIITALAAAAVGFYLLYTRCETFRHIVQVVFQWIKDHWPLLLGILLGPFGAAAGAIFYFWRPIKNFFTSLPGEIKGVFVGLGQWIADQFMKPIRAIARFLVNNWPDVPGFMGPPGFLKAIAGSGKKGKDANTAVSYNLPNFPHKRKHRAVGGMTSGWTMVGEHGPEMAYMRSGTRVYDTRQTADMYTGALRAVFAEAGGGDITIPLYLDGRKVAEAVQRRTNMQKARR